MKALEDEKQKDGPITQKEIDEVKAKHAGIHKAIRKAFRQALEIGDWFIESHKRLGIKGGGHDAGWAKWLGANFPEMAPTTIREYMRLARNRQFLEVKFNFNSTDSVELEKLPWIRQALEAIAEKNAEEKAKRRSDEPIDIEASPGDGTGPVGKSFFGHDATPMWMAPPVAVQIDAEEKGLKIEDPDEEPEKILQTKIYNYVSWLWQALYFEAEITEYLRLSDFSQESLEWCIKLGCSQHSELVEMVTQKFASRKR
jgi:hypothetical protein